MKCYCYEKETEFIFCIENAEGKIYENLQADRYWTRTDHDKFIKVYPMNTGWNDAWYLVSQYKETIKNNFAPLGQAWLEGVFDWKKQKRQDRGN